MRFATTLKPACYNKLTTQFLGIKYATAIKPIRKAHQPVETNG